VERWQTCKQSTQPVSLTISIRMLISFEFLVRGVVCQVNDSDDFSPAGRDLISDDRLVQLRNDVHLFQELGLNSIYICAYTLSPRCPLVLTVEIRLTTREAMLRR
jgi:hypothetical protein